MWRNSETDYILDIEEDELDDQPSDWGEDPQEEEEHEWIDGEDGENIEKLPKLKHDDRANYRKYVSQVIGATKYYVFVSPMRNHAQTFRKKTDQRKHMWKYRNAVKTSKATQGCRELYTSRTSKVSRRGLGVCRKRAQEWQQWHSD